MPGSTSTVYLYPAATRRMYHRTTPFHGWCATTDRPSCVRTRISGCSPVRMRTSAKVNPFSRIGSVIVSMLEVTVTSSASEAAWPVTANHPNVSGSPCGVGATNIRLDIPVSGSCAVRCSCCSRIRRGVPLVIPGATQSPCSYGTKTTNRWSSLSSSTAAISSRASTATGTVEVSRRCTIRVAMATAGCSETAALNGFSLRFPSLPFACGHASTAVRHLRWYLR